MEGRNLKQSTVPHLSDILKYINDFDCFVILDKNLAIMREEKGVIDLMKAMETHEKEASVIDFACSALWGLSLEGNVS